MLLHYRILEYWTFRELQQCVHSPLCCLLSKLTIIIFVILNIISRIIIVDSLCYHQEWRRRMEMKEVFYQCITYYYQGQQVSEASKPGECLAYFTGARDKLAEAFKLAKVWHLVTYFEVDFE